MNSWPSGAQNVSPSLELWVDDQEDGLRMASCYASLKVTSDDSAISTNGSPVSASAVISVAINSAGAWSISQSGSGLVTSVVSTCLSHGL